MKASSSSYQCLRFAFALHQQFAYLQRVAITSLQTHQLDQHYLVGQWCTQHYLMTIYIYTMYTDIYNAHSVGYKAWIWGAGQSLGGKMTETLSLALEAAQQISIRSPTKDATLALWKSQCSVPYYNHFTANDNNNSNKYLSLLELRTVEICISLQTEHEILGRRREQLWVVITQTQHKTSLQHTTLQLSDKQGGSVGQNCSMLWSISQCKASLQRKTLRHTTIEWPFVRDYLGSRYHKKLSVFTHSHPWGRRKRIRTDNKVHCMGAHFLSTSCWHFTWTDYTFDLHQSL